MVLLQRCHNNRTWRCACNNACRQSAFNLSFDMFNFLIIAVVPGVITSYYVESTKLRADESSAKFLDDLEHLPQLSKEELVELSEKVKKFNRKK